MSLLVCVPNRDNSKLIDKLQQLLPDTDIQIWPDITSFEKIEVVLAWNAPSSLWSQLPNLKLVQSYGAGVDSIDFDSLPEGVQVARIVDTSLATDMAEYVLTHVLAHKLRLTQYIRQQKEQIWKPNRAFPHNKVGILGFGQLGQAAADRLLQNGFEVSAWSASEKQHNKVQCVHGQEGLWSLVEAADYVVCLLPLTEETTGILNRDFFSKMPEHAVLINVARGKHLVEQDLVDALDAGELRAATLDVFTVEPLVAAHPFWSHEKITITPHAAALTCLNTAIHQIAENVLNVASNKEIQHLVDKRKGY
ncbi:2-hydroxyacid dehydrogenase [Pseudoalteromonas xiamenensis]